MSKEFFILCVCAGNIHRSALAEALLETWAGWYLSPDSSGLVRVHSAGLIAEHGVPMGDRARTIASALGAEDRPRTATPLTDSLVASADIVLTATRRQADEVVQRVPAALRTTFTMREAGRAARSFGERPSNEGSTPRDLRAIVAELAVLRHAGAPDDDDVIDPQGRGEDAYLLMARQEVPALADVAVALFGMSRADRAAYAEAASDPAVLSEQ